MGDPKSGTRRRRAVGTRDRIMSRLETGEIKDEAGMASTVLATEVGYPGSSIAFAQLLSGMERSGLIEREIRGKRTYRITAAAGTLNGKADAATPNGRRPHHPAPAPSGPTALGLLHEARTGTAEFDYDELARRLLIQVIRQLATTPGQAADDEQQHDGTGLEKTVAGLEQELASVRTLHGNLRQENARLREQLRAAQRSLALAQERSAGPQVTEELDTAEVDLLERLLAPVTQRGRTAHGTIDGRREDTGTG